MDAEYIHKVQRWVQLDNRELEVTNQIKQLQEQNKPIVEEKEDLEQEIVDYVSNKKMEMLTINTSDGNIKFSKKSSTQSISIKLLRRLIADYSHENNTSINPDDIVNFIINSLEKKSKLIIKRNILD